MNKQDFRAKRLRLNLSVAVLGKITGFSSRAIRDWENPNTEFQPHTAAAKILDQLIAGWRPPEFKTRAPNGRTDAKNLRKGKKRK